MKKILDEVHSPLFDGISLEDRKTMLGCIGYHIELGTNCTTMRLNV